MDAVKNTPARRVDLSVTIGGHDASSFLRPYVTGFTYTDNATGKADEIQLELQNRDGKWTTDWWPPKGTPIIAGMECRDWFGPGQHGTLHCGQFTVDEVEYSGSPDKLTIKAVSASLTTGLRDTTRTKAWEKYSLQGVAEELASKNGLELQYFAEPGPFRRIDQREESDLAFLNRLAEANGANLKVHDGKLILFSARQGDARAGVLTIPKKGSQFSPARFNFKEKSEGTGYESCAVTYADPETREVLQCVSEAKLEVSAEVPTEAESASRQGKRKEINARVESLKEARRLSQSSLRAANKAEVTGSLDVMGHPSLMAGVTIALTGFGRFDGSYFIETSKHSLSSGYTTSCEIRKTLGY